MSSAFGSRPASGARKAWCCPHPAKATNRWQKPREIHMIIPVTPETWLSGYIQDIPTPFDTKGAVDLTAFRGLCERQIAAGVPAILVCETAGDTSTLSPAEHESVIRAAVDVARGLSRVIAGAGSNSTHHAIDLTRCAEAAG